MEKTFKDAYVRIAADVLVAGNSRMERSWRIENGFLYNVSLFDKTTAMEWLLAPSAVPAPYPEIQISDEAQNWRLETAVEQSVCLEESYLSARVISLFKTGELTFQIKIYPQAPAISTLLIIKGWPGSPDCALSRTQTAMGLENISDQTKKEAVNDLQEFFHLPYVHHYLTVVSLMDGSDSQDNLVQEEKHLLTNFPDVKARGNLFRLENRLTGAGLVFLKEAPLPHARPVKTDYDLLNRGDRFCFPGLGAGSEYERRSYPFTTLVYSGGNPGFTEALHSYQRRFRRYRPEKDEVIWHSIWGDRNRDGRVCEDFYRKEIKAAQALGIDFLYFIDGWQKGASANSVVAGGVWENQWAQDDYWEYNLKRFPNGLKKLTDMARAAGFKVGMWYNPDKTNDYANWQRDVDVILKRVNDLGLSNVKLDGVAFCTKPGELNLLRIMHEVVQRTAGETAIEIDITAGVRTGYYQAMSYGFLFLENRYTDWRKYYPYTTLRNLWQLAKYVDPRRLRIEVLNGQRNAHLYPNDPLAPCHYRADYLFAVAMAANPMAWFEAGGLEEAFAADLRGIIAVYKSVRDALHRCFIYPIGGEPDGFSWSGFQAHDSESGGGFIIVFRDNAPDDRGALAVNHLLFSDYDFELLAGEGQNAGYDRPSGRFSCEIHNPRRFAFYRYRKN